jgi:hypothetical protein
VPFPRFGYLYGIRWKVPPARATGIAGAEFARTARARGVDLASVFHDALDGTPLFNRCSVAVYVPGPDGAFLDCVSRYPAGAGIEERIRLDLEDNQVANAWRGNVLIATPDDGDAASADIGFQAGESAMISLPARFSLSWVNDMPWGVVRLGIFDGVPDTRTMLRENNGAALIRRLTRPMLRMLDASGIGMG